MASLYHNKRYDQCLSPSRERVKTWDDDTEFGLALVDRQFDSMFDAAWVFHDRPPSDPNGRNPNRDWFGYLVVRTSRVLALDVPLQNESVRTVSMGEGTYIGFAIKMQREVHNPSRKLSAKGHRRRSRTWYHTVKLPKFEVTQVYPVLSMSRVVISAQTKWDNTNGRVVDDTLWNINLGPWDCVTNYRHSGSTGRYENTAGRELLSTQPRFKTLKALAVSMWSVIMSHAAHGDGFDGYVGGEAARMYRDSWGITANDNWESLGDIDTSDGFQCGCCGRWYDDPEAFWGTHDGTVYCWNCFEDNALSCEWCDETMWGGEANTISLVGSSWDQCICNNCIETLQYCEHCERYVDPQTQTPVEWLDIKSSIDGRTYNMPVCEECAYEEGWRICNSCNEWFKPTVGGNSELCVNCRDDEDEEEGCSSLECVS